MKKNCQTFLANMQSMTLCDQRISGSAGQRNGESANKQSLPNGQRVSEVVNQQVGDSVGRWVSKCTAYLSRFANSLNNRDFNYQPDKKLLSDSPIRRFSDREASCSAYSLSPGFSIIELIIVIAVAGAIILVVANIPNSIGLIGKSKNESIAKEVATQTIENIRSKPYANHATGTVPISDNRINSLPGGTGTTLIEECTQELCGTDDDLKKITVTISWNQNNEPRSVILTTLITDGGLQ